MSRVRVWKGKKAGRKTARGQAVIESTVSIILFTMMLGLVMSISVYLYFQQALVTAAREGARYASLDQNLGSTTTQTTGETETQNYVINEIKQLTGQTYSSTTATITVTPPSASANQTPGQRQVTVTIAWKMTNPVGVYNLMNALGADGSSFKTIPVNATATMRYEE